MKLVLFIVAVVLGILLYRERGRSAALETELHAQRNHVQQIEQQLAAREAAVQAPASAGADPARRGASRAPSPAPKPGGWMWDTNRPDSRLNQRPSQR